MRFPVEIQGNLFLRKSQLIKHVGWILEKYRNGQKLDASDEAFMRTVFDDHPHRAVVLGSGIATVYVQYLHNDQRRFIIIRTDGSRRDIGWRKCISPGNPDQELKRVCRSLIRPQVIAFKNTLTERRCQQKDCRRIDPDGDVDHKTPHTFNTLVERWLKSVGMHASEVEIIPSPDYQENSKLEDDFLEQNWIEFHQEQAVLQFTCRNCNRSVLTRKANYAR